MHNHDQERNDGNRIILEWKEIKIIIWIKLGVNMNALMAGILLIMRKQTSKEYWHQGRWKENSLTK